MAVYVFATAEPLRIFNRAWSRPLWKDFTSSQQYRDWCNNGSLAGDYEETWLKFFSKWIRSRTASQLQPIKKALRDIREAQQEKWIEPLPGDPVRHKGKYNYRGEYQPGYPWMQFGSWRPLSLSERIQMGLARRPPVDDPVCIEVRLAKSPKKALIELRRCNHGVYDPEEDGHYCSVCNPLMCGGSVTEADKQYWNSRLDKACPEVVELEPSLTPERFDPSGELDPPGDVSAEHDDGLLYSLGMSAKAFLAQLRRSVGPAVGGFQMRQIRRPKRTKDSPAWVMENGKLAEYAKYLSTNRAGLAEGVDVAQSIACLWMYYRMGMTVPEISTELNLSQRAVENMKSLRVKRGNIFFKKLARVA